MTAISYWHLSIFILIVLNYIKTHKVLLSSKGYYKHSHWLTLFIFSWYTLHTDPAVTGTDAKRLKSPSSNFQFLSKTTFFLNEKDCFTAENLKLKSICTNIICLWSTNHKRVIPSIENKPQITWPSLNAPLVNMGSRTEQTSISMCVCSRI